MAASEGQHLPIIPHREFGENGFSGSQSRASCLDESEPPRSLAGRREERGVVHVGSVIGANGTVDGIQTSAFE